MEKLFSDNALYLVVGTLILLCAIASLLTGYYSFALIGFIISILNYVVAFYKR